MRVQGFTPGCGRLADRMAGPLAAVERFFERLFERPAARLFQTRLEPIQIQRSLERAMEAERVVRARRAYAPSAYRVLLNPADLASLDAGANTVRGELGETLRVYARAHGYILLARPSVEIDSSPVVAPGDIRVFAEPPNVPAAANGNELQPAPGVRAVSRPAPATDEAEFPMSQATAVFAAPQPRTPRAVLVVRSPGGVVERMNVKPGTMRVGRALDNEVVLADERVSRRHGQIAVRLGMLVYTDLGSTNGSYLNGSSVTEIALGPGDILQLGSSTIAIEPAA